MDEMIRYIFTSLRNSDATTYAVAKALKKQYAVNRTVACFAMSAALCMAIQDMEIRALRERVYEMKKDIKELKKTKGD